MTLNKLKHRRMTNLFGFAARSLLSRPWYCLAHTVLLTVSMSSIYLMLTLVLLIPPAWSGVFGFFQRGGLEATTDLLIFASAALLLSLLVIVVLTLRMQVRVSWRSNRDNYRLLLQIGFGNRELRHLLRLEGILLLGLAIPFAFMMSITIFRILLSQWNLDEYRESLLQPNNRAILFSLLTSMLLIEWSRTNLVRTLGLKSDYKENALLNSRRYKRYCRRQKSRQRSSLFVWANIKNMTRFYMPRQLAADLLTLAISFALVFFIYATKAGIRQPQVEQAGDLVSSAVSYDIVGRGMDQASFRKAFQNLLTELPKSSYNHFDYIYLKSEAVISIDVPISYLNSDFLRAIDSNANEISDEQSNKADDILTDEVDAVGGANAKTNELISLEFRIYPSSLISDDEDTGQMNAFLYSELNYVKKEGIINHKVNILSGDADGEFDLTSSDLMHHFAVMTEEDKLLHSETLPSSIDNGDAEDADSMPWYIDPISDGLMPILLVSEASYKSLVDTDAHGWMARVSVNESALITFQTIVNRDWISKHSQLVVSDYVSRRLQQSRINYTLDMLFDMTLFFMLQLALIQLIAFTQGQFFIREKELYLLYQIGSTLKQERSIIRYYCIRVYISAMLSAYVLTYAAATIWNRYIQPITAVSIHWPILPLVLISTTLYLAILVLTQLRFTRTTK